MGRLTTGRGTVHFIRAAPHVKVLRMTRKGDKGLKDNKHALLRLKHEAERAQYFAKRIRKEEYPSRGSMPGKNMTADAVIAGVLKGVEKATGKSLALDTLQHVTSVEECKYWIQVLKAMYTDVDGNLDKKAYCSALNTVRDSMLFTCGELRQAIKDAIRDGNESMVPGYETLINQYETNAAAIAAEISANGGKVN